MDKRFWDQELADKATAIDNAVKLGGVVIRPPKQTGFGSQEPKPPLLLDD